MHEIAAFLQGFPPFDTADDAVLRSLVSSCEIEYFPAGAEVLRAGGATSSHAFVVRSGHAELLDDGRVIDLLGPGELLGLPSMVSGLPPGLDVRAAEDLLTYRLPAETLLPLLSGRSGLRFLARTVRARTAPSTPIGLMAESATEAVGTVSRPAVVVDANAPLLTVVRAMRDSDASCAIVTMPGGALGIVTDHDLRNRVLAAGVSRSVDVGTVATSPARCVPPTTGTDDAVLTMLALGIRHLPVVAEDGTVVGVVEDIDLLAAQSRTPVRVRRAIARASTPTELVTVAQRIRPSVVGAINAGHPPATVTTTLSTLHEAVLVKAIELHLRQRGVPPVPFTWLVTGSVSRREAVLSSDLDSLLAWAGPDDDVVVKRWMRTFATEVLVTVGACGLRHDENGVRADDPRFSRSLDSWREVVRAWGEDPTRDQADLYLAALADARPVWGDAVWSPVAREVNDTLARPLVRHALHRVAAAHRPPTGFLRDLVIEGSGEHAGRLDLKRGGLAPATSMARYLAALTGTSATSTVERVLAAQARDLIAAHDGRDLIDALAVVQSVRLDHQAGHPAEDAGADDHVRPESLTTLERRQLREAFRVIGRMQRSLPSVPTAS
jgi:CBS domain-containing protein